MDKHLKHLKDIFQSKKISMPKMENKLKARYQNSKNMLTKTFKDFDFHQKGSEANVNKLFNGLKNSCWTYFLVSARNNFNVSYRKGNVEIKKVEKQPRQKSKDSIEKVAVCKLKTLLKSEKSQPELKQEQLAQPEQSSESESKTEKHYQREAINLYENKHEDDQAKTEIVEDKVEAQKEPLPEANLVTICNQTVIETEANTVTTEVIKE